MHIYIYVVNCFHKAATYGIIAAVQQASRLYNVFEASFWICPSGEACLNVSREVRDVGV